MSGSTQMIAELMRQPVLAVGPGASVGEVRALIEGKHIHHVPIVQRGKVLGVVCSCDIGQARSKLRVLQLARRNVVTAEPDRSAADVAALMREHAVGSVLVTNRDGLWGIVTRDDLTQATPELAAMLAGLECASCHSTHHLQRGEDDTFVCASCAERASATHWYDEGGGD